MSSEAMMDVSNAEIQDEIANSLLGDEYQDDVSDPSEAGAGEGQEEQIADSLGDEPQAELEADELEAQQFETEPGQEQQDPQQQVEWTPQAIQEGLQSLASDVDRLELNDEAAAGRLSYDLTAPFGIDPASIDSKALGSTMAKVVLSAHQNFEKTGGDASQVPIPRDSAVAFTNDFLRSWGLDPRTISINPEQFSSVILAGTMNFLQAANTYGLDASLDRLNTPEAAEAFANAFHKCFGQNQPVTRDYALKIADAGGRYILSTLKKLAAHQAQAPPGQQQRSRQGRSSSGARQGSGARQSQPRSRAGQQRFQSNADLFDDATMDAYTREHGRL